MAKLTPASDVGIPAPRFTRWAWLYFIAFVCLPVFIVAGLLDVVMFLLFRDVLGGCYAIFCLF